MFIHENGAFNIEPVNKSIRKIRTSTRDMAPREDEFLNDYIIIKKEDIIY